MLGRLACTTTYGTAPLSELKEKRRCPTRSAAQNQPCFQAGSAKKLTRGQLGFHFACTSRIKDRPVVARTRIFFLSVERETPFVEVCDDFSESREDLNRSRLACQSEKLEGSWQLATALPIHTAG